MRHLLSTAAASSTSSVIRDLLRLVERPDVLSLAGGLPAAESFDTAEVRAALDRALMSTGRYGPTALQYGATEGLDELRSLLGRGDDGAPPVPLERVVVTTGSQQGLDLLARVLCDPGDVVVVEGPTYLGAAQAFSMARARFEVVPVDADGLRTDLLAERLAGGLRPKACYVVGHFQNPSGATLSLERRHELAALAARYGFVVIDDDPYRALAFDGAALPGVRAFGDHVVALGSCSKVVAPGLRVGWMIVPPELRDAVVKAKQAADLHTSTLTQMLCVALLSDRTKVAAREADLRGGYAERAGVLWGALAPLRERGLLEANEPRGGMFVWGRTAGLDTTVLLTSAIEHGVAYVPGAAFAPAGGFDDYLRLSFASLRPVDLTAAAARLGAALEAALASTGRSTLPR